MLEHRYNNRGIPQLPATRLIQLTTSFLKEGKGYFLPCAWELLEETLYLKIQPNIDMQLRCIEAYYLDRAKNKVIQLNLIGLGFLYLLYTLRVIILQDLVVLYREFLLYPLQKDLLFSYKKYYRFTMQVESSLANIVVLDKLIIQKYQPTYRAILKLRYKVIILEIKGVQLGIQLILGYLDKIERLLVLFTPIQIQ